MNIKALLSTQEQWASIALRLPAGIIFTAHGAQKLFAWFGGYGLEGTAQFMATQGLTPGFIMALLVGIAEFFGGIALLLGFLTRLSSVVLSMTMVVAIFSVHFSSGLFVANGGYEFALALLAMSVALIFLGGGRLSVDKVLTHAFFKA